MTDTPAKTCTRCGEQKPLTDFSPRNVGSRLGRQSWCKPCCREYAQQRRAKDPDKRAQDKAQAAAYNAANARLRALHLREFNALYAEEKRARGIKPWTAP